jgi:hypothetical protein
VEKLRQRGTPDKASEDVWVRRGVSFRLTAVMRQKSSSATARVLVWIASSAGTPRCGAAAVAILLVVLSHVAVPGFEGCFVGVNEFLAISGFFTASMLLLSPSSPESEFRWVLGQPDA